MRSVEGGGDEVSREGRYMTHSERGDGNGDNRGGDGDDRQW